MQVSGAGGEDGAVRVVEGGNLLPFRIGEKELVVPGLLRLRTGEDLLVLGDETKDAAGESDGTRRLAGPGLEEER